MKTTERTTERTIERTTERTTERTAAELMAKPRPERMNAALTTSSLIKIAINGEQVSQSHNLITNKGVEALLMGLFSEQQLRLMLTQRTPSIFHSKDLPVAAAAFTPARTITIERDELHKTYARIRASYSHSFVATEKTAFNALALTRPDDKEPLEAIAHTHARTTDMLGRPALITVLEGEQVTITYDVIIESGYDTPVTALISGQFYQATRNVSAATLDFGAINLHYNSEKVVGGRVAFTLNTLSKVSQLVFKVTSLGKSRQYLIDEIVLGPLSYKLSSPALVTDHRLVLNLTLGW